MANKEEIGEIEEKEEKIRGNTGYVQTADAADYFTRKKKKLANLLGFFKSKI